MSNSAKFDMTLNATIAILVVFIGGIALVNFQFARAISANRSQHADSIRIYKDGQYAVRATQDIPADTLISADMVKQDFIPKMRCPKNYLDCSYAVYGRRSSRAIKQGTILDTQLVGLQR